jgi:hypothetical protein
MKYQPSAWPAWPTLDDILRAAGERTRPIPPPSERVLALLERPEWTYGEFMALSCGEQMALIDAVKSRAVPGVPVDRT